MSDSQRGAPELQFDRAMPQTTLPSASQIGVVCARCRQAILTEYFDLNGHPLCGRCRTAIEAHADVPRGVGPFGTAAVFGLGAGMAGAAIYYAVIAIANLEIGIVAILIGYMVGRAVRHGAGGRGGRRYQVLAAALTYASVALAYAPLVRGVPLGVMLALPVIMVIKTLPMGAISAFIILIGMRQAWQMTGAPRLAILGPFRVGTPAAVAP